MIERHKLSAATKILSAVSKISKEHTFTLGTYCNGREQGYALTNTKTILRYGLFPMVTFSESRGSDAIVVYFGTDEDFGTAGNVPSEDVCNKVKRFKPDQIEKAAQYVFHCLTNKR